MKRRFPIYAILALIATALVSSCNDDSDDMSTLIPDSSADAVMVNTFSLEANDSVLANLDSVFFSIDLDRAVIFNADSLPVGTKVDRLVTEMTFSGVRKAEITMPSSTGADTVVDYLKNPNDSIDFSRGSVKLHLESASGTVTRDYTIYVNVHKVNPDRMEWSKMNWTLPTKLASVMEQRTVDFGDGTVFCFTTDGTSVCRASSQAPLDSWTFTDVTIPADARLSTLVAADGKMFIVDSNNTLFESTDCGLSWSQTSARMSYIYGVVGGKAIGVIDDGGYKTVTYPASTANPIVDGMPVAGTSAAVVYTTEWSDAPMLIVAGGVDADGNAVNGVWACDGGVWAKLSSSLPALEAPMVVPYYAFRTSTVWKVTRRSVLLCFGGLLNGSTPNRNVYISYDMGVNWTLAPSDMALPATYTPGSYAQAIVVNQTLGSRAVKPITEWDCPYIYAFGGEGINMTTSTDVWRAVINRLEFKPLQ